MPGSVAISHHEPGLVAFQSVKPVAQYRAIREDVLAGNDYRCPSYIRPTVGCVNVGHGLEDKITVAGGPVEDCDSPELLNGQGWPPQFNGPDVAGVAADDVEHTAMVVSGDSQRAGRWTVDFQAVGEGQIRV